MQEQTKSGRKYFSTPGSMRLVKAVTKDIDGCRMPSKRSFGGQSFSDHNRTVFAAQIARALRYNEGGYEGPRLTDEQFEKLTDTLQYIKEHPRTEQLKL